MARNNENQINKGKLIFGVVVEIVIMATEILCCLLPMPWRLAVPIAIGARGIISKAVRYAKNPPAAPIVYCNGIKQTKSHTPRGNAAKDKSSTAGKRSARKQK